MQSDDPNEEMIELSMRRADGARVARYAGHHYHAAEIEDGLWDDGLAVTTLGPFFRGVTLLPR
jgi:hypothetical protein